MWIYNQLFSLAKICVKLWNGAPIELRELMKTPLKQEVSKLFLKILENGDIDVDFRYFQNSLSLSLISSLLVLALKLALEYTPSFHFILDYHC